MDILPFAKREPRIRNDNNTKPKEKTAFDPIVEYSIPQNRQQVPYRPIQTGIYRTPKLKITSRQLDSRNDQRTRNKENLFFDPYNLDKIEVKLPKTPHVSTRHEHVPYNYDTKWISIPEKNSGLEISEDEKFKTSFLSSPIHEKDKIQREKYKQMISNKIHTFEDRINHYIEEKDKNIKKKDEDTLFGIQKKRNEHLDALELRKLREKIRYFE